MKKVTKGLLALNLAGAIRLARFGPRDARRRLAEAYDRIDPFGGEAGADGADPDAVAALAHIPEVALTDIIRGRPIIKVDATARQVDGAMPWCDVLALLAVLVDRAPRAVLEVGTFHGHTTRLLALNMPSATVHTVDLPESYDPGADPDSTTKDDFHLISSRRVGSIYRADPSVTNVVQHFGDTAAWDFGAAEGATFYIIDGSHTYEFARNDTEKALAAASGRAATLLWHDCDRWHAGVARWIAEMAGTGHVVRRIAETNLAILDVSA